MHVDWNHWSAFSEPIQELIISEPLFLNSKLFLCRPIVGGCVAFHLFTFADGTAVSQLPSIRIIRISMNIFSSNIKFIKTKQWFILLFSKEKQQQISYSIKATNKKGKTGEKKLLNRGCYSMKTLIFVFDNIYPSESYSLYYYYYYLTTPTTRTTAITTMAVAVAAAVAHCSFDSCDLFIFNSPEISPIQCHSPIHFHWIILLFLI